MKTINNKYSVEGTIISVKKIWWIKINMKTFRKSYLDGATFPYLIKVKYKINDIDYEKNKIVYWKNEAINVFDKVIVVCDENKPLNIRLFKKK